MPGGARTAAPVADLVAQRARSAPQSIVLGAPGRPGLSAAELKKLVSGVGTLLRERGIGPTGRVVVITRSGAEAASVFLAVASAAACAPLNAAYRENELEFALEDLRADALIVEAGLETPARAVAAARNVPVLELEPVRDGPAGLFSLDGVIPESSGPLQDAAPDATALLLHTSGTTSRPKLVPLAQHNLVASARNVAETLRLEPADVCLNVMPLFHIHGLVAAVLAPLASGAGAWCAPGFDGLQFPVWLKESGATWTTAVPTVYQSLLRVAHDRPESFAGHRLRFVRSSSAALPVALLGRLEDALEVPVVEAYGMTEAAHQMASNPVPPGRRLPGSVGPAAGPELAILDPDGRQLPSGEVGEVAICGENVFGGYEANPEANAAAFAGSWFRTGDEGCLDDDGYLHLRGRLKEIINRGGEKISPREVDEALSAHPAVAQAVAFAMPDARLGEEVAAAVVLAPGATATERELQDFAVNRIAPFKVPRRIVTLDEIPKGATGKLQRIGLAETLGLTEVTPEGDSPAPSTPLELELCKLWGQVLGGRLVGVRDDFFSLGGDSLRGAELVARIRDLCGRPDLPLISIVRAPTVESMVVELSDQRQPIKGLLVPFAGDGGERLFLVHGVAGDVIGFAALAARLPPGHTVVGIRAHGVDGDGAGPATVEEIADEYLAAVRGLQPSGPYVLGGYCMGCAVAVEMARTLEVVGEQVTLVLVDPRVRPPRSPRSLAWTVSRRLRRGGIRAAVARRLASSSVAAPGGAAMPTWERLAGARNAYRPRPIAVPAHLVTSVNHDDWGVPPFWWSSYLRGPLRRYPVAGPHDRLFHIPYVEALTVAVASALEEAV